MGTTWLTAMSELYGRQYEMSHVKKLTKSLCLPQLFLLAKGERCVLGFSRCRGRIVFQF